MHGPYLTNTNDQIPPTYLGFEDANFHEEHGIWSEICPHATKGVDFKTTGSHAAQGHSPDPKRAIKNKRASTKREGA